MRLGRCTKESPYSSVQAVRCIFVDGLHYLCFHSERMCAWEKEREQCKCVASERVFCLYFTFLKIFQSSLSVWHIGPVFIEAVCTVVVSQCNIESIDFSLPLHGEWVQASEPSHCYSVKINVLVPCWKWKNLERNLSYWYSMEMNTCILWTLQEYGSLTWDVVLVANTSACVWWESLEAGKDFSTVNGRRWFITHVLYSAVSIAWGMLAERSLCVLVKLVLFSVMLRDLFMFCVCLHLIACFL